MNNSFLTVNIKGNLMSLDTPKVMGIVNVTPDSFFKDSRVEEGKKILAAVDRMVSQGVDILDLGGCSTRPGFIPPSEEEELRRVELGCHVIRDKYPAMPLSIDTYRASVAEMALKKWEADIINDISGGEDPEMVRIVAENRAVYVLTHNRQYEEGSDIVAFTLTDLSKKISELHRLGINDIIVDPGFGFSKKIDDNFIILDNLNEIVDIGFPVLVGLSRKSMIWKTLGVTPDESLTGTVALQAIALEKGANILRVHDVREAVETVRLYNRLKQR